VVTVVCFAFATLVLDLAVKKVVDDYQTIFEQAILRPHQNEKNENCLSRGRWMVGQFHT
jgi:hypothetical protein